MLQRIFIAINLPDKIKEELELEKEKIENLFPEEGRGMFNWVGKENLHITLAFIGPISNQLIPEITENVKKAIAGKKPFLIRLKKISYNPGTMPPRLIWLEIEKSKELLEIANQVKKEFTEKRIGQTENKSFSPHITLARIKAWQWKQIEPEEQPEIEKEIDLEFQAESVEIMESQLKRTGAEYSILESVVLQ